MWGQQHPKYATVVHRRSGKNTDEKPNNRMATLNDSNIDLSKSCRMIFVRDEFLNEKYFRQKGLLNSICDRHKVYIMS